LPFAFGSPGLIDAASNAGSASAAIAFGLTGASGSGHANSSFTYLRFRGCGTPPWVQVPVRFTPSESSFPSYVAVSEGTEILTVGPASVTALAELCGP